jgi:hypothetical protein
MVYHRRGTPCGFRNKCASPLSMVEVKLGTVLVGLNLGRFVNRILWKDTGRTGFDCMIGPFMSRVRCGFEASALHPFASKNKNSAHVG